MTHEFDFAFTDRDQFYAIVASNLECGKGNWTIKGSTQRIKTIERNKNIQAILQL